MTMEPPVLFVRRMTLEEAFAFVNTIYERATEAERRANRAYPNTPREPLLKTTVIDVVWPLGAQEASATSAPIPLRLVCPECKALHVDEGEFATKPHHTHACQRCGNVWRPAIVPTVGVRFLPGFKDGGES